ncbi:DUF4231 domain-containing protein [Metamycoplasma phocicerebrale]|uniref:DUF4231 domain-containing protein n=1 Tax=Metamycoplasma phocicerebrale TaxID=142649 RepID=A0A3Q9VA82_9BACT|nr:DUF4231 domain-containing protein [Metamycoplasma phocicerebrale]AZZ65537.1 DUF4231 domain-containing protein [Metamycoplasma phocicerebrale]
MTKNKKKTNNFLVEYVDNLEKTLKIKYAFWNFWFGIFNVAILTVAMILSIFSSIQLFYDFKWAKDFQNYLLITSGITAITSFLTSIMSFFTLKKRIIQYKARLEKIRIEKFLFKEKNRYL